MRIPQPLNGLSSLFDRIKRILGKEILHGFIVADVEASKLGTVVSHKLGRMPVGAIVIESTSSVVLSDFTTTTITAYGSNTARIWIF